MTDDWLNVADVVVTHVEVAGINEAAFGQNYKSGTFGQIMKTTIGYFEDLSLTTTFF